MLATAAQVIAAYMHQAIHIYTSHSSISISKKKKSILESTKQKRERPSDRAKQIFSRPPFNQVSPATELFYAETMEKQLSDWVMLHPSFLFISLSTKH